VTGGQGPVRIEVDKHVMVPMRDGVRLATNVYRLAGDDQGPALLVRTPYGKDAPDLAPPGSTADRFALVEAGYAVVHQDVRGTGRSEGVFTPLVTEPDDAADTIAWLTGEPWCDGTVGMYGGSYLGMTQVGAALSGAPGLAAITPSVATADQYHAPWYSHGGALALHTSLSWSYLMATVDTQRPPGLGRTDPDPVGPLAAALADPLRMLRRTPLRDQPLLARHGSWYGTWLDHPDHDAYWQDQAVGRDLGRITVPALTIAGWFDIYLGASLDLYTGLRDRGGSPEARTGGRLVIGPWTHLAFSGIYPDRSFGPSANALGQDFTGLHLRFFDRWLRGREDALDGAKPVRIFVMGIDEWRDEDDWPLPGTRHTDYFLSSSGTANTADGDGILSARRPGKRQQDVYLYDPRRPVPTMGGNLMYASETRMAGPVDQRPVEARGDVLCYSTPPLERPVEVTGRVSLTLCFSSSAPDTDVTAKLVDVFPDGRAIYLTEGVLRLRYRESPSQPELMEPGTVYEVTLDLWATSNVFRPGHRIRLEVSSSNFPRFDRNTNTGGAIAEDGENDMVVAVNRVHHGPSHPSRLTLPIIDRR
jgi:putative CocE/NonD family hydrolase